MQAHDVMTAEVVTVNADTPLPQIACVLLEHGISAVPVLDADGVPIGMVSDCDLATHSASDRSGRRDWWLGLLADGSSLDDNVLQLLRSPDRTAGNVMATPVITVGEATELVELVRLLARNHIKRVRVLKDGHIKGIISRVDDAARLATERQRQETAEILINTHVSDEAWQQMLRHAREAAGKGATEWLVLRFPNQLCSDGARAINIADVGWPATLRGETAELYLRWEQELRPTGFGLSAYVLEFPGGMPGDIGLFLVWGE